MIYFEYRRQDSSLLASNFPDGFVDPFLDVEKQNLKTKKARNLFREISHGSVRVLVVEEDEYLNSKRLSKSLLDVYVLLHGVVVDFDNSNVQKLADTLRLFAHNLIDVHTHLKGKVGRIFSDEVRYAGDYVTQKKLVKENILKNPDNAADDFCQVSKRIDDLEAQIVTVSLLSGITKQQVSNTGKYNLKKIILRHAQPFFEELDRLGIKIQFESTDYDFDSNKVVVDPRMINASFHHFFQNATKYCLPYSQIKISLNVGQATVLYVTMMSVRIDKDELQTVFQKGVSGNHVGALAGQGIGMYVIKSALEHFGASIAVHPDYSKSDTRNNIQYIENCFVIEFPKG